MTTKKFGDNSKNYPAEMRTQLWPLCCGASIISGFKNVGNLTEDELVEQIQNICDNYIPDHQVYSQEIIRPSLTFLTLNKSQMDSKKIMNAVKKANFVQFATAKPRGARQGFFVRDKSETFNATAIAG